MKVLIGVDPHKGSHTAVAIDGDENQLAMLRVGATKAQCDQLLAWATAFPEPALGDRVGRRARLPAGPAARRGRPGCGRCAADAVGPGAGAGVGQVEQE